VQVCSCARCLCRVHGLVLMLNHEHFSQGVREVFLPSFFDVVIRNYTTFLMVDVCMLEVLSVVLGFHTHTLHVVASEQSLPSYHSDYLSDY